MTDRADEIALTVVRDATVKVAEDVCVIGHDRSGLIECIADALRFYAEERMTEERRHVAS